MSADTVTDAITAWFAPPAVIGLNKVHDSAPWFDAAPGWELDSQLGWGAVGYVHLEHQEETRIAMGGAEGGLKQVVYDAGLALQFAFLIPVDFDPSVDGTGYRRPLNQLLDGAVARLRQDRTLGTAPGVSGLGGIEIGATGAVIQAGEGDGTGGPDIVIDRDLPKRDVGRLWSWNLIRFKVVEVLVT